MYTVFLFFSCVQKEKVLMKENKEDRKRELKKKLTKVVTETEQLLYKGKRIIIVVVIPALEVLANLLTLMDEDDRDDENWY